MQQKKNETYHCDFIDDCNINNNNNNNKNINNNNIIINYNNNDDKNESYNNGRDKDNNISNFHVNIIVIITTITMITIKHTIFK